MKTLLLIANSVLIVCGAMLTLLGSVGILVLDVDSAVYMRCQLYAIQGLVMLVCLRD